MVCRTHNLPYFPGIPLDRYLAYVVEQTYSLGNFLPSFDSQAHNGSTGGAAPSAPTYANYHAVNRGGNIYQAVATTSDSSHGNTADNIELGLDQTNRSTIPGNGRKLGSGITPNTEKSTLHK
jgi:hypothetical protein